jgi:hypothetical protein
MKKLLVIGGLVTGALAAHAQGTVRFANVGGLIPAGQAGPITFAGDFRPGSPLGGGGPAAGAAFVAQLQVNSAGTWADLGTASPFRTGAAAGYWTAADVTVPGVAGGATATLRVAAWAADLGSSFSAAMASGLGGVGTSFDMAVVLGGAGDPPTLPAQLTSLVPFGIAPIGIPEPSSAALGFLGAGLLMIRRKRSSL